MLVMGIESSCDECSVAVVEDGKRILSNEIATQIDFHRPFDGVVPEIASRMHTEWILTVAKNALEKAGVGLENIDGIAVTNRPGLVGSLLVGLNFAKGLALSKGIPFVGVDHIPSSNCSGRCPNSCLIASATSRFINFVHRGSLPSSSQIHSAGSAWPSSPIYRAAWS